MIKLELEKEYNQLKEILSNAKTYYLKDLAEKNKKLVKMPKEAVEMYNIMQNNYKGE